MKMSEYIVELQKQLEEHGDLDIVLQYTSPFRVAVWEYERGWGSRVDSYEYFNTLDEAHKYVREFNSRNIANVVPDWYMTAQAEINPDYRIDVMVGVCERSN